MKMSKNLMKIKLKEKAAVNTYISPDVYIKMSEVMESVLENVIPSEEKKSVEIDVKLDKPDEDGNSWKAIDEDTYEKVQRGEL